MLISRPFSVALLLILVPVSSKNSLAQTLGWDIGNSYRNSDANDGPSWPRPGQNSNSNNDAANGLILGLSVIDALVKGAQANERNQQQMKPWPSNQQWQQPQNQPPRYTQPQYTQPQYTQPKYSQPQYTQPTTRYVEPRPVYVPPPVEKKVVVRANPKPVERIADTKNNTKPSLSSFSLANKTELDLLKQVIDKEAKEDFEEIVDGLGDVATKSSDVAKILEEAKQAVIDGKPLDPNWKERLKTAVGNAIALDPTLATKLTTADFDKLANDFENTTGALSAINNSLDLVDNGPLIGGNSGSSGGPFLPSGMTQVVFVPVLGADDVLVAPGGGAIIMGTGGEGSLDTLSVNAADALGIPIGIGEPEPDTTSKASERVKDGVVLSNPKKNDVDINYVVANHNYTIKPGYSQTLPGGKSWEIRFSRGDGLAEAKYTLKDGTYFFGSGSDGWELYRQSFSVTVDNTSNDQPFNYVADNTEVEIPAGQTKKHSSSFPIMLRFDRGDGGEEAVKKITKDGHYLKLGVSPMDGLWDLFPEESSISLANPQKSSSASSKMAEKDPSRLRRLQALLKASKG